MCVFTPSFFLHSATLTVRDDQSLRDAPIGRTPTGAPKGLRIMFAYYVYSCVLISSYFSSLTNQPFDAFFMRKFDQFRVH